MKKLSPRHRNWLIFQARRAGRRHAKTALFGQLVTNAGVSLIQLTKNDEIPPTLCLDQAPHDTLDFFFHLRARTVNRGLPTFKGRPRRVGWAQGYTDFTTLRTISPGAALILAAEYDRIYRVAQFAPTAIDLDRWDEKVYAALYHLGFFRLLGLETGRAYLPDPSNTEIIQAPMLRGEDTNWSAAGEVLIDLFEKVGGDQALRVNLLGAIVDAIENVRGHAYGQRSPLQERLIPPFWWLSGAADVSNRRLTLSIYDQGSTIPVTLPKVWSEGAISGAFQALFGRQSDVSSSDYDAEALEVAMKLSSTSTGLSERGKGLSKIRHVVSQCPGARLRVVSRRGNYSYHNGVDAYSLHGIPLLGTYIEIEATF
jgi:hypothetical protein